MTQPFTGVITALATPFLTTHQLDFPSFEGLLASQSSNGTHGVVVGGTTGEGPTLSPGELEELVIQALSFQTARFRIYVGVGSNCTTTAVALARQFSRPLGPHSKQVDGLMAVVPYYNKPTQMGLMAHFGAIAQAVGALPLCLYNVPSRTGSSLEPETAAALCHLHKNIVAIKEASGSIHTFTSFLCALEERALADRVHLLSGDDPTWAPSLGCGGAGVISVTSHLIPKAFVAIWEASQEGRWQTVHRLHRDLFSLQNALFVAPNPIPLKYALNHLGFCGPTLRLPLTPLATSLEKGLLDAVEKAQKQGWVLPSQNRNGTGGGSPCP